MCTRAAPYAQGKVANHRLFAEKAPFHDGHAWFMYWDFPLNGPDYPDRSHGPEQWPLGGSDAEQAVTLRACDGRWPRMGNYSLTYGNSFWITLNTWPPSDWNSPELREWLQATLASPEARKATWKFVVCYLPPFHSGTGYPRTQKMRVCADLFEAGGVDIVFSSYIHVYQRSKPLRFKPAVTPNYEAFIGAGKDGLVICDPLHFLPTQLRVNRATPSAQLRIGRREELRGGWGLAD